MIPTQVVTDLRANETVLRILRPTGAGSFSVNGVQVEVSCVVKAYPVAVEALERRAG